MRIWQTSRLPAGASLSALRRRLETAYLCGRVRTRTVKNFCSWSIRFATVSLSGTICALSAALPHFRKNKAAAPLPLIRFCKLFRAMIRVEEIRSSARRQFTIGAFLPFSVLIYFSCLLLDRTRIHQSGGGCAPRPVIPAVWAQKPAQLRLRRHCFQSY